MIISPSLRKKLNKTPGVNEHRGKLRGHFRLPGDNKYTKKSFNLAATATNVTVAQNRLGAINTDISNGTYDVDPKAFWRKHFPNDSMHIEEKVTLASYFKQYRDDREHELSYSILCKLTTCENWLNSFGLLNKDVKSIDHNTINQLRKESVKTRAVTTVKEYSHVLRQVLWLAINDEVIESDPFLRVRKLTADDNTEDECVLPFSDTELSALLAVIHLPQTKLIVELLSWTGLRPGELKALAWEDVHLDKCYIEIKYNINRRGELKPPKTTASKRKVELVPRAVEILKELKGMTFNKPELPEIVHYKNKKTKLVKRRRVVLNNNKPYLRPELTTAPKQWSNWLKEAKISYRPSYQLRHTYASRMLTANANQAWLAQQMGHKDWGMIRTIYAQWIPANNPNHITEISKTLGQKYNNDSEGFSISKDFQFYTANCEFKFN